MGRLDGRLSDRLERRAVPAVLLLLIASFVFMAGLLVQVARQWDRHTREQAYALARAVLERRAELIAKDAKDYAAWGEAYQHLHAIVDVHWAYEQQNLGRTLFTDLGYDDILVIGPKDAATYAVTDGVLTPPLAVRFSGPELDRLVSNARTAPPGESRPVAGFIWVDGAPYLVAATAITTGHDPTIATVPGRSSVLVLADALTGRRLEEIGEMGLVNGLRLCDGPADGDRLQASTLTGLNTRSSLIFCWTPERPGRRLMVLVLPWIGIACASFSVLVYFALRRATQTARLIETQALALVAAHAQAEYLALHDSVTTLPNRIKLGLFLESLLKTPRKSRPAVLYIDLDRFKEVNDRLGHRAGDTVLSVIAKRLQDVVQETDLVARVGGDEFVIVLASVHDIAQAEDISRRLLDVVQKPVSIGSAVVQVGLSIGITMIDSDAITSEQILNRADAAMYEAKLAGGDGYRICPQGATDL